MKVYRTVLRTALCGFLFFEFHATIHAQSRIDPRPTGVLHQYPLSGAVEVPTGTEIGVRAIGAYDAGWLRSGTFVAIGSKTGAHQMTPRLTRDRSMVIFHPSTPFANGEQVSFPLTAQLVGGGIIADSIHFKTMIRPVPANAKEILQRYYANDGEVFQSPKSDGIVQPMGEDGALPAMNVTVDDSATPGTIYLANFGFSSVPNDYFLFNFDQHGTIVRQKDLGAAWGLDFKQQPTGLETYYETDIGGFVGIDSNWNIIDTFKALNYGTDEHELRVFTDKSYALMGISMTYVNMDTIITGGYDSAIVLGNVIQVFDADGNMTFQWRGIDHYDIIDSKYEDLTASEIDFEHANALDFDNDGNIIISNRHLCEISKLNGVTGDFMFRLGGAHNQFTLVGDTMWFSFQHAARWIPDGDLTIFDNSNYDTVTGGNGAWIQKSRACEYRLDTNAKTATLVWQFHHAPETWSAAMGYVERLPNGNTFIGWGDDTQVTATEVRPDNSTAFEMDMHNGNVSYRAMKVVADTGLITIKDTTATVMPLSMNRNDFSIATASDGSPIASFTLPESETVSLDMYDMTGRKIASILTSVFESAGSHTIPLDENAAPNGAYECVFSTTSGVSSRPFYILK